MDNKGIFLKWTWLKIFKNSAAFQDYHQQFSFQPCKRFSIFQKDWQNPNPQPPTHKPNPNLNLKMLECMKIHTKKKKRIPEFHSNSRQKIPFRAFFLSPKTRDSNRKSIPRVKIQEINQKEFKKSENKQKKKIKKRNKTEKPRKRKTKKTSEKGIKINLTLNPDPDFFDYLARIFRSSTTSIRHLECNLKKRKTERVACENSSDQREWRRSNLCI